MCVCVCVCCAGNSVRLDGSNDYIRAPGFTKALGDLTVCLWVKFRSTNSGGGRQYMIDMRGDGSSNNGQNFYFLVDENQRNKKVRGTVKPPGQGLRYANEGILLFFTRHWICRLPPPLHNFLKHASCPLSIRRHLSANALMLSRRT